MMRSPTRAIPYLALLLLVAGEAVPAGEDDTEIAPALAAIRSAESYDDEAVGYAGVKTETFKAFEILKARASVELLLRLTDDENPILRCYAVRALLEAHPDHAIEPVLLRHIEDTAEVETFAGCCRGTELVGDVMLSMSRERLSGQWGERILERLLDPACKLAERATALLSREFGPRFEARIRALAESGDEEALVALARYRDPQDLPLISAPLAAESAPYIGRLRALEAAELHANPALMPALAALEAEARIALTGGSPHHAKFWYAAVAAQESPEAAALLLRALETEGLSEHAVERNPELMLEVLADHLVEVYRPVLWELWSTHGHLTREVFDFLAVDDPSRAASVSETFLTEHLDRIPTDCYPPMFALLAGRRPERVVPLLVRALRSADVHHFEALAELAAARKDEALVDPLFARFTGETNPHFYLHAAEALLAYGRVDLREKLVALVSEHAHLRSGWGGRQLAELLGR